MKRVPVLLFSLVLLLGAAFVATKEAEIAPYFQFQSEYGQQNISVFDAQDENYYVFLPSCSNLDQVRVMLPRGREFFLGDIRLSDKMSCEVFELEKPYGFFVDGNYVATLWFYQSQNVPAMFVETASGEMAAIHDDKNYEEYASMTLYAPDGRIHHYDAGSRLKGRGNSTWERDKRPYLLTLSSDKDLLGMSRGKKWVLLANAYDETNLNNKLAFDLAAQVDLAWSPDSRFVDLYLNGVYSGLYLLAEKVEVQPDRVDIDVSSGDFLCKLDLWTREEVLRNSLESSLGRTVEVCAPEVLSETELALVADQVGRMESAICSGEDLGESQILDLDSWVRRYILDEISGNIDADLTSSYFYFTDGKFYAGPVWDYDMAFGNNYRNQEPHAFLAKNEKKTTKYSSPYYSALYKNESFYQRVVEIYRSEFAPVLQDMILYGIDDQLASIQAAAQMNSIRWRAMYDDWNRQTEGTAIVCSPETLKSWVTRRVRFLDSAWLEGKAYCTVQFAEGEGAYWTISTEKGTVLETSYKDLGNPAWSDSRTGLPVDFRSPITGDLTVTMELPDELS